MAELTSHHVGITVGDLDRAVEFYTDVFGLDVDRRFTVTGEAFSEAVDVANATGSFAHLDADGVVVELVEYDPEGRPAKADGLNQPGVVHLGFSTPDLDAFADGLDDGIDTLSDPQTTSSGTRILFVRDPEGNLVEVIEADD